MYAVIKTGGKQYRVAPDDELEVEKVAGDVGTLVKFADVLMLAGSGAPTVGKPLISGAVVTAEVVAHGRGPKVIAFKKRRRKNSRRRRGHRQEFTLVKVLEVLAAGQQPSRQPTGEGARRLQRGRSFALLSAADGTADDLSLIDGVGPKMLAELNKAGVYHFWQLAAASADDVAALEEKGEFDGRIKREEWVEQARELLAGKPPRAKSDRERAEEEKKD